MVDIEQIFPSLTWRIRHLALYPDESFDFAKLPDDFDGLHFGLYRDHKLTGVVSLFQQGNDYQFRKLAVLPGWLNQSYGSTLLNYITDFCKIQNAGKLWCNARVNAIGFYLKSGLVETDVSFSKEGVHFVVMEKNFNLSAREG